MLAFFAALAAAGPAFYETHPALQKRCNDPKDDGVC